MREFTGVFEQDGEWWIGWVEEVGGVFAQERTLEEARVSLEGALEDVLRFQRELTEKEHGTAVRQPIRIGAA
ncbi:MAG: type II toxin-antitoxin system HicB family antitoxin [Dehalococcoidia bacterium]|nr:type II toxin-antitoxin system HicB family antitoxin [Dehalococcoidia bacterium]